MPDVTFSSRAQFNFKLGTKRGHVLRNTLGKLALKGSGEGYDSVNSKIHVCLFFGYSCAQINLNNNLKMPRLSPSCLVLEFRQ